MNLFQILVGQHFAGKRDPDRQDAAFDRLPSEDLTLLVKTEVADRREIDVHPRGQADAAAGEACGRRGVVEDPTELLAFSIDVARHVVVTVVFETRAGYCERDRVVALTEVLIGPAGAEIRAREIEQRASGNGKVDHL